LQSNQKGVRKAKKRRWKDEDVAIEGADALVFGRRMITTEPIPNLILHALNNQNSVLSPPYAHRLWAFSKGL